MCTQYAGSFGGYGGQEQHVGKFNAEMMTWSDEKLQKYVNDILAEREVEKLAKESKAAKEKEEKERKELERLKAKYEQ